MSTHSIFKALVAGMAALCACAAQGYQMTIGLVPTEWVASAKPARADQIRSPSGEAPQVMAAAPGEVPTPFIAIPSNSSLNPKRVSVYNWTVFAYDTATGLIVPNVDISLDALRHQPMSGGHDHDSSDRPKGSLSKYSGNTGPSGLDLNIQYTAPEVSGVVYSDGSCSGPNGFYCYPGQFYSFTTAIGGLQNLEPSPIYELTGSYGMPRVSSIHYSNHWGTSEFNAKLQAAALLYFLEYSGTASGRLLIDDMSLEKGGLFDIDNTWAPAHSEHRIGVIADIKILNTRRTKFDQMLIIVGIVGATYPHSSHLHIIEFQTKE